MNMSSPPPTPHPQHTQNQSEQTQHQFIHMHHAVTNCKAYRSYHSRRMSKSGSVCIMVNRSIQPDNSHMVVLLDSKHFSQYFYNLADLHLLRGIPRFFSMWSCKTAACFLFSSTPNFPMDIRAAVPHGSVLPPHTAGRSGITVATQY